MNKAKYIGEVTIYKSQKGFYSIGISNKLMDGSYDNMFFPVQFKKGVELDNKTDINITNGWITFYRDKDNKPVPKIMVLDFTQVGEQPENITDDIMSFDGSDLPF